MTRSTGKTRRITDDVEISCACCTKCYRVERVFQEYGVTVCQYGGPFTGYEKEVEEWLR